MNKMNKNLMTLAFFAGLGLVSGLAPSPSPNYNKIEVRCGSGSVYFTESEDAALEQIRKLAKSSDKKISFEDAFVIYKNQGNFKIVDVGYKEEPGHCSIDNKLINKLKIRGHFISTHTHPTGHNNRNRIYSPMSTSDIGAAEQLRQRYCDAKVGPVDSRHFWYTVADLSDTVNNASKKYSKLTSNFIKSQYEKGFNFDYEKDKFIHKAADLGFYLECRDIKGSISKAKSPKKFNPNYRIRQIKK